MQQRRSATRISKYLALILRHRPVAADVVLDPEGWADVEQVLIAIRSRFGPFDRRQLEELVQTDDKQRYAFDESGTCIRANQGHSIQVDLGLQPVQPPAVLYHGTSGRFLPSILAEGLVKGKRHHVHLSPDIETAFRVGCRRGKDAVVLEIRSGEMRDHPFYRSANGVWLVDQVPPEFVRELHS